MSTAWKATKVQLPMTRDRSSAIRSPRPVLRSTSWLTSRTGGCSWLWRTRLRVMSSSSRETVIGVVRRKYPAKLLKVGALALGLRGRRPGTADVEDVAVKGADEGFGQG